MKAFYQKIWCDATAILFFLALSLAYFFVPVTQGMVLSGSDNSAGIGLGQEIARHQEATGEITRWTNAIFGGMPTFQIAPNYHSRSMLSLLRQIYELGLGGALMYVFILLLGFYIFMRVLKYKSWLSALGAIAWAFSSYFFIIIGAGHIWKVLTLAFIPPTIAGLVLCYRGKYLWGGAVTALFFSFQILSNHLQMTYYFGFVMLFMIVAYFVQALKQHTLAAFWKSTAAFAVALLIGLFTNLPSLYHTYEYSKETMRGTASIESASNGQKSGLSKEYITQWSYGIGETWTLLVPNAKGGASIPLAMNEKAMEKADPQLSQLYRQIGQYWGEQPGTSGPVYVGAFILLLFILGCFVVKGPMKWALIAATLFSILLSWGHNLPGLTNFFIDHVPMYNKFRTVASILVIAEFTIPLLAMMALAKIIEQPELIRKDPKPLYASFILTGGFALLFALFPTLFFPHYVSSSETEQLNRAFADSPQVAQTIISNLSAIRRYIFVSDAWRSFFIILIGFLMLLAFKYKKLKASALTIGLIALCLIDMYTINKRYLNDHNFVEEHLTEQGFQKTPADEYILQDEHLDYRVLNFTKSTFNENETAYYHKSIGGYHPAKLGRYQDLISHDIAPEMQRLSQALQQSLGDPAAIDFSQICPVINMLNTRYFIFGTDARQVVYNPDAQDNAWFVGQVQFVPSAGEELKQLSHSDLKKEAIAQQQFQPLLSGNTAGADSLGTITLTQYAPNELHYDATSPAGGVVVFSEIYYPGWKATIDGQPLELACANYVLRAAYVPAGQHKIVMEFRPASVKVTETIAFIALFLLIIGFAGAFYLSFIKTKKQ
ncbi:MAG: YfhO family protein [Bacteroidaceae bacterium]|nr:YfhO family protein [Bacteroidaceae bacterium]